MITKVFHNLTRLYRFSSINQPPAIFQEIRTELQNNGWRLPDKTHQASQKTHLSNAEKLIHKIPVLYVHTDVVRCIGGTQLNAGHPQVYIQVNTRKRGQPVSCKYCGLRYAYESHDHHQEHSH